MWMASESGPRNLRRMQSCSFGRRKVKGGRLIRSVALFVGSCSIIELQLQ